VKISSLNKGWKFLLFGSVSLLMIGCDNTNEQSGDTQSQSTKVSQKTITAEHSAVKTLKKYMDRTSVSMKQTLDVLDYYIELPTKASKGLINGAPFSLTNLEDIIDDPSTMTRIRGTKSLSSTSENSQEVITLADELREIMDAFKKDVKAFAPSFKDALTLDNVELLEDGTLVVDRYIVLDPMTLHGAIEIEMLNAKARGEEMEKIYIELDKATSQYQTSDEGKTLHGHSRVKTGLWVYGKVYYIWDANINATVKSALLLAMNDWSKKTDDRVTFFELSKDNPLIEWSILWGNKKYFILKSENLGTNINGDSHIGITTTSSNLQTGTLRIDPNLEFLTMHATVRHEIGHMLGLSHEHQRWDRDKYIVVNKTGSNYDIIAQEVKRTHTSIYYEKVWVTTWWFFGYWKYVPKTTTKSYTTIETKTSEVFDCRSIMMYSGFTTRQSCSGISKNQLITDTMVMNISDEDVAYVKSIYNYIPEGMRITLY
jgi:hypothetical protein